MKPSNGQVENQRAQNKLAMFGEQQGRSVRAEPQVKMTFDRALEAEFRGEGRAARAAERPFFGSADVLNAQWSGGDSKVAAKDPQAAPKWRARDFVARPAVHPVRLIPCITRTEGGVQWLEVGRNCYLVVPTFRMRSSSSVWRSVFSFGILTHRHSSLSL